MKKTTRNKGSKGSKSPAPASATSKKLLDTLIVLDKNTNRHFYEMGQLLSALAHGKLWKTLGYTSMHHLVEEELSFTSTTALKYIKVYNSMKLAGYTENEAVDYINTFGFTPLSRVVVNKGKLGKRAMANCIAACEFNQINFKLTDEEVKQVRRALKKVGASVSNNRRRIGASSEAFMSMVRFINSSQVSVLDHNLRVVKNAAVA